MNNFTPEWSKFIISTFKSKDFHKISDSLDFFIASILQSNPNADIITIQKFVSILSTEYFFKLWKQNEFDKFMVQVFNEVYEKINPLKNNWPVLKEKYEDLTSTINQTLSTSGDEEECKPLPELTEISVKKYIVAILNQNSSYNENSAKTQTMNRSLIDDFTKILNQPTELNILRKAVLALQPYIYNEEKNCNNCGYCDKCIPQKFDTNSPYYITLIKKLNELCEQMSYYELKKRGEKGSTGAKGDKGDTGGKGDKGDKGDPGSITNLATINNRKLDTGENFNLATSVQLAQVWTRVINEFQKKIWILKNKLSGVTNADLDDEGNLRIWDPQFEGSKLVKDFGIIDSSVVGIESTDDTLPTTKYIDKFYVEKKDLLEQKKWTSVGTVNNDGKIFSVFYTLKPNTVYRLKYLLQIDNPDDGLVYSRTTNYVFFETLNNFDKNNEWAYFLGEDTKTKKPLIYVYSYGHPDRNKIKFLQNLAKVNFWENSIELVILKLEEKQLFSQAPEPVSEAEMEQFLFRSGLDVDIPQSVILQEHPLTPTKLSKKMSEWLITEPTAMEEVNFVNLFKNWRSTKII